MVLLFGTIVGDLAQLSSVGVRAVRQFYGPEGAPAWLVASDGRIIMLLLTLGIVLPLCCLRRWADCMDELRGSPTVSCGVVVTDSGHRAAPVLPS